MPQPSQPDSPTPSPAASKPAVKHLTNAELCSEYHAKRKKVNAGGGEDKQAERNQRGLMSARQRLEKLFSPDTFQEIGAFATHDARFFGMAGKPLPTDGVIVGTGYIDDNIQVAAFSQDFTVCAGTLGSMHAKKIVALQKHALKVGIPVVAMQDSGGARIQEGVDALSGYGNVFYQNVLLSGVVPQIALILGPCAGGAAYSPALMDFVIMTRENAYMFITGPEIIKAVTGQTCSMSEIGGAEVHANVSGNAHFVVDNEEQAIALAKKLLSYFPANNSDDPPHDLSQDIDLSNDSAMLDLLPQDRRDPFDVLEVIKRLVDHGDFTEVHAGFAQNIVVGFARVAGMVTGIVANQPIHLAGALNINAADKAARFIRFCNAFNIPVTTLVDVPGFMPGMEQELGGIIRHGAKMLHAYASCTVPKITIILRKAFGGSYLAMCSQEMGADIVLAWPTAEIAVMGAEGAVSLLYRKELAGLADKEAAKVEFAEAYRHEFSSPYLSAARGYVTDIIDPGETRNQLAMYLRKLLEKRELRPAKKHGNMPL